MSDDSGDVPTADSEEPPIILVGLAGKNYYLYKGDDYLNQILLVDGQFPTPILCVNFETLIDAARVMGSGFSIGSLWAVHPEVVQRLRDQKQLVETDA